eukprot:GHVO01018413.1.p3 GENE.GHVO01018413.1~~GHVO01018413.1.p3  ORF type:complete len:154 (-),score=34.30 GHVO01018413.1:1479-1940(-)
MRSTPPTTSVPMAPSWKVGGGGRSVYPPPEIQSLPGPDIGADKVASTPIGRCDPRLMEEVDACVREYDIPCPVSFTLLSGISNEDLQCAPNDAYDGPCTHPFTHINMTQSAKKRWSNECMAWWPCARDTCRPTGTCPGEWEAKKETPTIHWSL